MRRFWAWLTEEDSDRLYSLGLFAVLAVLLGSLVFAGDDTAACSIRVESHPTEITTTTRETP